MSTRTYIFFVFFVGLVCLAACGDGGGGPPGDDAPDANAGAIDAPGAAIDSNSQTAPDADPNCPADQVPPGAGACPSECTTCLPGNVCRIECGEADCNDTTITCPEEYACEIVCTGVDACDTTVIECPPLYPCSISCDGNDACGDIVLECGDATCGITCAADSCAGAAVDCGTGACSASCTGDPPPTLDCTAACGCNPC